MALVKQTEYEIEERNLESVPLRPTVPVTWIRDHCRPGDKIGLFIDADTNDLVIRKLDPKRKAS